MRHMKDGNNVGLVAKRGFPDSDKTSPAFVSDSLIDNRFWTCSGSRGIDYIFPLYLYEENMGKVEKRVNLDKDIVAMIAAVLKRVEALAYYHGFELGRTWYDVASCDDISSLPTIAVTPDPAVDRAKAKAIFREMKPVRNLLFCLHVFLTFW